jgi:hypothetical protein
VSPTDHDRQLRAELAAELGFFPASLAPEDLERHRQMNAHADDSSGQERVVRKHAHLAEQRRLADAESRGRSVVADLYH